MECASCGRASQPGARFCGGCGQPLVPRCAACGAAGELGARFCQACGAPFAGPAPEDPAARKVVTIVFADLRGSTPLQERLDPESSQRFMNRYHDAMRAEVEAERGVVTQLLGDGVKAVFGVPRVAEDDALRAVRAGVAMQRAFRELLAAEAHRVGEIGLRVAVNTGEVVASAEREIIGDPVTVAARLQEEARVGDVVIAEPTRRLVADLVSLAPLGTFAVKGRSERVPAYRVVSLERPTASATAFVGREAELARIRAVFDDTVAARAARLAVILGSPGLGKSRLIGEVARRLAESASVLTARCDSAGGATFAPIAAALRAQLGIDDGVSGEALYAAIHAATNGDAPERARVAAGIAALLAGTPASHQETFFVVRRFLAGVAADRPAVLVLDDLQWAEPLLLDLVEHLIQWSANTPLLVLVGARPELREARSSLTVAGPLVAEVVTLAGLDAAAATRLAANAIGADELPAAIAGRVLTASEGNPLYVGELVRMLVQDGVLAREGERWTTRGALAALEMPPTIQALLAARIERLRPEERTVLERASVIGRQFSRAALAELVPRDTVDLDRVLEALRRSELVESDSGWFLGEPALRFHHVLTRDAAYRRLLKNRRAELHERFADWVQRRVGDEAPHDETIGWHLEQAHQHLSELGPVDPRGRALGERAARTLGAAGRRALERDDLPLAASLLGRAVARLDEADPARAELALDWCEALLSAGEVGAAAAAIDEFGRFADASPRLRAWHTCFAGQRAALTDPESLRVTVAAVSAAAEALAAEGDTAGEAKGHLVHALALARLGRMGACEAALDRAQAAARRVGDRRRANSVLAAVPLAVLSGPSPVTRASGRCLDVVRVLRITQGSPAVEAVALRCQGVLEALRGRSEAARRMVASSRRMVEELGITHRLLEADVFAGRIELIEGDAAAAERWLRAAYAGLREHGLGTDAAQAAALLARALLALGRAAEAEELSHESEKLAGDDLPASIAWRGVRAQALAQRGEHATAVELARAAVELAAATDALLDHADARIALAAALRAAGRSGEATVEEARAIELWEAKGATRLAERARNAGGRAAEPAMGPRAQLEPFRAARRVRPNHATAHLAAVDGAVAARDLQRLSWLLGEETQAVNHAAGQTYRVGELFRWRVEASPALAFRSEAIAALGPSLALARWRESGSEVVAREVPVGAWDLEGKVLIEADAEARATRIEVFGADHLGDAVVRLYERYAELLPPGPARERAAATARAVSAYSGPIDLALLATVYAPDVEHVDRRSLGLFSGHGVDEVLRLSTSLVAAAPDAANRIEDVLEARADAWLVRLTNFGTDRGTGGAFERHLLMLVVVGADGRVIRRELFDPDREVEALARFDELTGPAPRPSQRRVPSNRATASAERFVRAVAARDVATVEALHSDAVQNVMRPTGVVLGRRELIDWWRLFFRDSEATLRLKPLAVLGDALALQHQSWRGSGAVDEVFAVGPFQLDSLAVTEVDASGRFDRLDDFPLDRLGDALVRLYERYGELQPEGPQRERAAATARAIAVYSGPTNVERFVSCWAHDVEYVDLRTIGIGSTRGVAALRRIVESLVEAAPDATNRVDAVLGARPDAVLLLNTNFGHDRSSGGPYERPFLRLMTFGASGLVTRVEQFDPDHEPEALARFDELSPRPAPPSARRRVRIGAANVDIDRFNAALAARDTETIAALYSDRLLVLDHKTGSVVDAQGTLDWLRMFLGDRDAVVWGEPIASLGDSLVLNRLSWSGSASVDPVLSVGAFEAAELDLVEIEAGRAVRVESFSPDQLGDAVVRLYERYAELLPEGFARAAALATARDVRGSVSLDLERAPASLAPDFERIDHRTLGFASARGPEFVRTLETFREVALDVRLRVDDVLAVRPEALLWRITHLGTGRESGGSFERTCLSLAVYGADGRAIRAEQFDPDAEMQALARFDELTRASAARPIRRAVRPNLATAFLLEDAELLATLGESLALCRHHDIRLLETDPAGHGLRVESFASDQLDRALTRLYERYAELLPEGPARERAAVVAAHRSLVDPKDLLRNEAAYAPDLEHVDHRRTIGLGITRGRAEVMQRYRVLFEAAPGASHRTDDVLGARPDALLRRVTHFGTASATGGAFERVFLMLSTYGADGLVARLEQYDSDAENEALARFEELTDPRPALRRVRPNAATANERGLERAVAARDADGIAEYVAEIREVVHHPTGERYDGAGSRETFRALLRAREGSYRSEPLATLGDSLALCRQRISAAGTDGRTWDIGPYEMENLVLAEVDGRGRRHRTEIFAADSLGNALARLYERFAELLPGGPARDRAASTARSVATATGPMDLERLEAAYSPAIEHVDRRRTIGLGTTRGRDAFLRTLRALVEATRNSNNRTDDILAARPDALLRRVTNSGIDHATGGSFERVFLMLSTYGADGRVTRVEQFDPDAEAEALARFDELTAAAEISPEPWFANAATRSMVQMCDAWNARNWPAIEALYAPEMRFFDRRKVALIELDRAGVLAFHRVTFEMESSRVEVELLATRGERLGLARLLVEVSGGDVGASELESLMVVEMNEQGQRTAAVRFDPEDLDAAYDEIDRRYADAEDSHQRTAFNRVGRAIANREWDALATFLSPELVVHDHRHLGWDTLHGPGPYIESLRALAELSPDARLRVDHSRGSARGRIGWTTWIGTREGGEYELPRVVVNELDLFGRPWRFDFYDPEQIDQALARFAELQPDPHGIPANAATRVRERAFAAIADRDWDTVRALTSPDFQFLDRGRQALVSGGLETWLDTMHVYLAEGVRALRELVATAGDRIAIERVIWARDSVGSELEIDQIVVSEIDADGRLREVIRFDPDDRRAAFAEAATRFAKGEAAGIASQALIEAFDRALATSDAAAIRACLADDFVLDDRRGPGVLGALDREQWLASVATLLELAPDWDFEVPRILAWNERGRVHLIRIFGTREGGPFESLFVRVVQTDGERVRRIESFDLDDADRALARFAALC